MPLPEDYIKVTLVTQSFTGKQCNSILWYQNNVAPPPEDVGAVAAEIAQSFDATWAPLLKLMMAVDARYQAVLVSYNLTGATYNASSVVSMGLGTQAGDCMPNFVSTIVQRRTALPGKVGRGRCYFGPVAELLCDDQSLTATGGGIMTDIAVQMMQEVEITAPYVLIPMHLSEGTTLVPLTSTRALYNLGTMRRRMVRPRF